MPGTQEQRDALLAAYHSGVLDKDALDVSVTRILTAILKSPSYSQYPYTDQPDLKQHAQVARKAAAEGIVLLKNKEGILPLKHQDLKIAAFGIGSYEFIAGGSGSGDVNEAYTVSLVEGLANTGYAVEAGIKHIYDEYIAIEKAKLPEKDYFFELLPPIPEMNLSVDDIAQLAKETDIALITIGRNSGEFQDRELEGDYYLTAAEKEMIAQVSQSYHALEKKVVLVLNIGNVIETASWRNGVDAIVLAWQGGQEAGNALADVLTGKVNPSGKLTSTFTIQYSDTPSARSFPGAKLPGAEEVFLGPISKGFPAEVNYKEGIFVGYRHYLTHGVEVAYPFGYGLSYTEFSYADLSLSKDHFDGDILLSITISNTGKVAGKEVVQLYLTAPGESMQKPAAELKGFAKTQLLKPGESQQLSFTLIARDLASFDTARNTWVAEAGQYRVRIGASCLDIRAEQLFELAEEIVLEK
jgi:beta-glucosidase